MKIRWGWVLSAVVVLLVIAALMIRIWFISPGIRILGQEIHVDLSRTCYIIDGQTGGLVDETTVTVKGATSRSDAEIFDGELKILGYQNSASGKVTALKAIERKENGCWVITHLENCTHRETDENGISKNVEHFCDYSYTSYFYPDAPEQTVVLIESFDEYKPMYAVCADSEKGALERYEDFLEHRP